MIFGWQSFEPTLMPRSAVTQAAITALCIAIGYALGTLCSRAVRYGLRRAGWTISPQAWKIARLVLAVVAVVALVVGLWSWIGWQNDQRDLLGMDHIGAATIIPLLVVAVILLAVLVATGRLVGAAVRGLDRWNRRHLSRLAALVITAMVVFAVSTYLLRDVAFERFTLWAYSSFGAADQTTDEDVTAPESATVSGSPDSLVTWDTLGRNGRSFVAGATTVADLQRYWGADVTLTEPVRAYVGGQSGSVEERAELAVKELERSGGFDRSVLVVATATGSGWIDPDAARALEMMHRGDSAIVSMQYSFLPSWIAFITELDGAAQSGTSLFNAVHQRWSELPADHRPALVAFGLSLGSYGAEFAFAGADAATSLANVEARTDGTLLVGPTNSNPMHQQFIADRDSGSTVWSPSFEEGRDVVFITRDPDELLPGEDDAESTPRTWPLVYVQHPSDPVTQWGIDWLWSSSAWNDRPRGYDVPAVGSWFPIVTWTQGVFDLMAGFSAPPGFGHDYRLDYVRAWGHVVPPEGWTNAETTRLEEFLTSESS